MIKNRQNTFSLVSEVYFRAGHLLLTGSSENILDKELPQLSRFEQGYFYIHTAAALNHKYARFIMAMFLENGLIPSLEVTKIATSLKFNFLPVLDPSAIIFENKYPSLVQYEKKSQASALE